MLNVETHEQILVAAWLRQNGIFFTISPAGIRLPVWIGKRFKDMGYRAGTCDLLIFEPRGRWHGLFIEMKRSDSGILDLSKGRLSPAQKEFIGEASKRDYQVNVCYGSDEAITTISRYLGGTSNEKI